MRAPARPRLPDGDCVFISDVRIVAYHGPRRHSGARIDCANSLNSLMTAAGGLHAKSWLSFKAGVFGAIGPPKVVSHALWDKTTTQHPEFEMRF